MVHQDFLIFLNLGLTAIWPPIIPNEDAAFCALRSECSRAIEFLNSFFCHRGYFGRFRALVGREAKNFSPGRGSIYMDSV